MGVARQHVQGEACPQEDGGARRQFHGQVRGRGRGGKVERREGRGGHPGEASEKEAAQERPGGGSSFEKQSDAVPCRPPGLHDRRNGFPPRDALLKKKLETDA